jgi:di/tricarboxylate transporter
MSWQGWLTHARVIRRRVSGAGASPRAVAVAASGGFRTPVRYQTNTVVYGPGGDRFGDHSRLGFPVTIAVLAAVILPVPIFWPL